MKKKMRKFAEGGYETAEGENENIKDDTRSRARKFIEDGSPEQDTGAKPVTVTKTKTSVTASKPKEESSDEYKDRMEKLTKSQALERVEPENYIPGTGLLKGMIKNAAKPFAKEVSSAASRVAKNDAAETAVRTRAAKVRGEANDAASTAVRARAAAARGKDNDAASKSVRERASKLGLKSGGSVSSASRRADGCCIRGKTRA
jgi:metal-dependent amidase/aminoacylase/carboxypeptidase family protein